MLFARINRSDPEKIFIAVKNGSGATLTAGYPAYWDCEMTTPDGVQVTNSATSTTLATFAGLADADIANGAYGLLQVYGYRASAQIQSSAGSSVKGDTLMITNVAGSALTVSAFAAATQAKYKTYGFLMAAVTASSSSAYQTTANIFLRAL